MKRFELIFTFLQLPLDYLMLVLAGFTAYSLRFSDLITSIRPVLFNLSWNSYWPMVLGVAAGWIVIFIFSNLYTINPNRKFAAEFTRIILACSTGFAAITIYVFFTLQKFDSRFLVLVGWIIAMIFIIVERMLLRGIKALLYRAGIGLRKVIIIGNQTISQKLQETFLSKSYLGYKVSGIYEHFDKNTSTAILETKPDEILFTDPRANEEEVLKAIDFTNEHHIVFRYSADLFSTISTNISVSTVAGIPIIELRRTRLTGWGRINKRLMDIIFSLIFLIILSPIYLIIAIIILIETGRPIIYKNERVGQKGSKFFTLKFRSMFQKDCTGLQFAKTSADALQKEQELIKNQSIKTGPVYKIKNDPRVTPYGRFIRRWSLDELPQFWNVLKGDMSLVGPRPHQPREVDQYEKRHKIVLDAKPGITGLAQISGRSDLNFEEEARLDTFYIENWNWLLDLIILLKTPFVVIKRKGAL
ncbi:MAG: Undecaprenyl-phosphate glucose phosphotransferase [Candidatus Magasanikbacteria bacterium GW2011_GWC2_34_16]|uniref:Undecaprenyl-phosphate glucose phosphotransferase n=2 Tax=Candidatus Magasanikiibacteriota TaxID=1752731 RepID=A0A0G0AR14_9BACT|nr:MAG: Undecaprenyl-phosphate glucose phosphotransferase [Candidatus Magasanikbacteria bacterium GW2011_GWC2_34_16]